MRIRQATSATLASLLFGLLSLGGCSGSAHADQLYGPVVAPGSRIAIGIAPAKLRAPYDVQVIRENGETLPTYSHRDRFYVQGNADERYVIRVTNPTPNRVEAVVTVDGLDVIDGESGDLRKRGYVVPAYGDVRIEGFRTSNADVATFRFSSVNDSYAGRKGKARNVGVIAVAIFEETPPAAEQQIIVGGGYRDRYDLEDDGDRGYGGDESVSSRSAPSPGTSVSRAPAKRSAEAPTAAPPSTGRAEARRPAPDSTSAGDSSGASAPSEWHGDYLAPPPRPTAPRSRPGLGTEFGEQRYSAASHTRFVRAHNRPIAIAELRYNNAAGLIALGIHAEPLPDAHEIMTRETADPFPGDRGFARPPR